MRDITEFSIKLEPPHPVLYPGQKISGEINLETAIEMDIEKIVVYLAGKGHSKWQESRGIGKNQRQMVDRIGKENIVKLSEIVFDAIKSDGTDTRTFSPGLYQYQFTFVLPDDLPSSFEGKFGFIRYVLKARISRPGKDDIVKLPVSINEIIDPNDIQYTTEENGKVHEETGFLCLKGWFDFKAKISRNCYCPGEPIFMDVSVTNRTGSHMKSLNVKLLQKVTYKCKKDRKEVVEEIASLEGPKVLKKADIVWKDQPFGIPATQPTIKNSKVITVQYILKVFVEVPIGDEPVINLNITLGTVPYLGTYGKEVTFGTPEDPKGIPKANFTDIDLPPPQPKLLGYPNMHPPVVSAAVGEKKVSIGQDKDFNTYGDLYYIPVYTFAKQYEGFYEWPAESTANNSQLIPVNDTLPVPEI